MLETVIVAIVAVALVGLAVKWIVVRVDNQAEVSWPEYAAVMVAVVAIVAPSVIFVGEKLSVANIVRYEQFVNGVETQAVDQVRTCTDGHRGFNGPPTNTNCSHSYASDSYIWTSQTCTTDSKGQISCTTYTHHETVYSPYLKREHIYSVEASMGGGGSPKPYSYGVYADSQPELFDNSTPPLPDSVPRGAPADWLEAKRRIEMGDPRPVTMLADYDNYILASKDATLIDYSDRIPEYLKAGLLPDPSHNLLTEPVHGPTKMLADKVAFVDVNVSNTAAWQDSVMRFNAALGMKLQGDLHVVVVNDQSVSLDQATSYVGALKAHWQSEVYGKRALAKNGVILVLGTDGQTITWAEATTGMPFGNQNMSQWVRDWLPGTELEPETIFGRPVTVIAPGIATKQFTDEDFKVTHSQPLGVFEEIIFEQAPFKRASMSCDGEDCVGFKSWLSKIEPSLAQKTMMVVTISLIAMILWLTVAFTTFVDRLTESLRRLIRK